MNVLYYLEVFIDPHGEYQYVFDNLSKLRLLLKTEYNLTKSEILNLTNKSIGFGTLIKGEFIRDEFKFRTVNEVNLTRR